MTTATTDTYDQVGIREDLSDSIWDVSPEEVPFSSNCKRSSCASTGFDWQTDSLAAVSATNAVEGADPTFSVASATTRLDNITAIIEKTAVVSGTLEATNRAGRGREMSYQIVKRAKEIKRDFEHQLVGVSRAKDAGSASQARQTASYHAWIADNADLGTSGSPAVATGNGSDTMTDGTQRAFVEASLETVIDSIWNNGGMPDVIMAGSFNKRKITNFSGNSSEQNIDRSSKKIINAVSVYESDYGTLKVVPNRFSRARDVFVYQSDMWKIRTLRGMKNSKIAKTGDSEKRQVIMEAGLEACNALASGIVADLTTA